MNRRFEVAQKLIEHMRKRAKTRHSESKCEEIEYYEDYAQPCYALEENQFIALGNWNQESEYVDGEHVITDNTMGILSRRLESIGAELDWNDECIACGDCGKLIRTTPAYYGDLSHYWISKDGDVTCAVCTRESYKEEYIEHLVTSTEEYEQVSANTVLSEEELEELGWVNANGIFENGWHPGQTDDPKDISEGVVNAGIEQHFYSIDHEGQFDIHFTVWIKPEDVGKYKAMKEAG